LALIQRCRSSKSGTGRKYYDVTFNNRCSRGGVEFWPRTIYRLHEDAFLALRDFGFVDLFYQVNPTLGPWDWVERGAAYIVGGGPSLTGFDFRKLGDRNVIACNRAHEFVAARYLVVWDYEIFLRPDGHGEKLKTKDFKAVFTKPGGGAIHPKAIELEWLGKKGRISDSLADGIHPVNSGMAALNIAYCLGYNPIFLLGFDCRVDVEGCRAHFYDDGPWGKAILTSEFGYRPEKMEHWRVIMDRQKRQYDFREVRIYNLNLESALTAYPKLDWREIFK